MSEHLDIHIYQLSPLRQDDVTVWSRQCFKGCLTLARGSGDILLGINGIMQKSALSQLPSA